VKDQYEVVVIGGGIVGCSVLYHLTLRGMTDIALIERDQLTAGSSWHAAGGFHIFNSDLRISELQQYTIDLYPQIEEESGQSVGLKMSGGLELAGTEERWRYLQSDHAWLRSMGHPDAKLLTPSPTV
jgi:dimethylglycine dehydrogenase